MSTSQRKSAVLTVAAWVEGPDRDDIRARLIRRADVRIDPTVEYAASRKHVLELVAAWLDELIGNAADGDRG